MAEGIVYKEKQLGRRKEDLDMNLIYNQLLLDIDEQLRQMGGSLTEHSKMPHRELTPEERLRRTLAEENFNRKEMTEIVNELSPKLNAGQSQLCDDLYQAVCNNQFPDTKLLAVSHSNNITIE